MIGAIENAMVERLDAASKSGALGYAYRECASLPEDIDVRLVKAVQRYPAAWVTFAKLGAVTQLGQGAARVEADFAVVVGAENLRNERAARQGGSPTEVGSYQLALDAAGLLIGQTLGLAMDALQLGGVTPVTPPPGASDRLNLFKVAFTTRFVITPAVAAGAIGDFITFHVDWDLPPHGDIDATSTIILETT